MIKSAKSGDDPYIALLNLRNTPNEGMSSSPVQRLMGRRTQSVLPATPAVLKPSKIPVSQHSRLQWKRFQSAQWDCSRSNLPPLRLGDHARIEPIDGKKEWRSASVTRALPHNNYEVWDGTRSFIRARKFLRKKPSPEPASSTVPDDSLSQRPSGLIPCDVPLPSQPTYRQQTSDNGDDSPCQPWEPCPTDCKFSTSFCSPQLNADQIRENSESSFKIELVNTSLNCFLDNSYNTAF